MSPPSPLQELHGLKTSPQFPAQIARILDGAEYRAAIKTLQDKDLAWLVEYLDNVCFCIILTPSVLSVGVGS